MISPLVILSVGFVAGCAVTYSLVGNKKQGSSGSKASSHLSRPRQISTTSSAPQAQPQATAIPKPQVPTELPGKEWFDKQMNSYAHDLLAFFISKNAMEQNLTATKTMELYEEYGRCPLQPSISEYEAGFRDAGLTITTLATVASNWLKAKNIQPDGSDWEKQITQSLEAQQMEKAKKIIEDCIKQA